GNFFLFQRTVKYRERQALRQDFRQQGTTNGGLETLEQRLPLPFGDFLVLVQTHRDTGLQLDFAGIVGALDFGNVHEEQAFALAVDTLACRVVQTQHDVLRRYDGRFAVGGEQHVVGGQHQGTRFQLGFQRQRYVNGHLVTVEVGVERSTNQRMQLNGLAFN